MTFVPQSRILPRALWRPAIFFFAVAQIFLSFAPLLEGRLGPDARAHVEELGTTAHHAHNDADCAACIARGLLSTASPQPVGSPLRIAGGQEMPVSSAYAVAAASNPLSRSRAPPVSTV
jgi:hypothetical protein